MIVVASIVSFIVMVGNMPDDHANSATPEPKPSPCLPGADAACTGSGGIPASAPAPKHEAKLLIHDHVTYEGGYVKITGKIENIGDRDVFSPIITLRVWDQHGTLLAQDEGIYPAGQLFTHMHPGASAAFESMVHVPGEPSYVNWDVSVGKYQFEEIKE
jgi:hypothetical protein